ncbi:MAG TPA: hypothetical protein VFW11_07380 [Cyclobacteriaceae bacterium]|nr:hypothetical protein [Cyclobacteriaceae bacterium]
MFFKLFFKNISPQRQINRLKSNGILLGSRIKSQRKVYIYMLSSLFVEVTFKNDNIDQDPEKIKILSGLKNLNDYLEKEFKTSFGAI